MKKLSFLSALLILGTSGFAQTDTASKPPAGPSFDNGLAVHHLKSNDAVLPRWAVDVNYRNGLINQQLQMIDLSKSYTESIASTSSFVQPTFSNGRTSGGDLSLSYFFNKRRNVGISIGGMYLHHTGTITMESMYADFKANYKDTVYRQIIRTNSPIKEDVITSNINIPIMLQFKHQFGSPTKPSNFGITGGVGALFGISNNTDMRLTTGTLSYEAIYKLSTDKNPAIVSGFDGNKIPNAEGTSFVVTEDFIRASGNNDIQIRSTIDSLRAHGALFNVGLDKGIAESQRSGSSSYTEISYGAIAQLGLSYALAYNVSFQLGAYAVYQTWTNKGNESYTPTDKIILENGNTSYANYRPLTGGMKQADYMAYGVSAGFRIFFGEKRDVDGDGVPDAVDKCKYEYGEARFNGCPDTDGDGIVDDQDACKYEKGPDYTNGCPDRDNDGVADKVDACPDEYGELRNGCPVGVRRDTPVDTTLTTETGVLMAPHIVLETDVLLFDLAKADIRDSAAATLDYAAKVLKNNPKVIIYLSGYTDDIGTYKNNLYLSYQRSKSASNYLKNKGIDSRRIIISGNGMEDPISTGVTPEARAKNRRVEMKLLLPL